MNHRLKPFEVATIVHECHKLDPLASIYLYGSRTNVLAKGGDIDLLVVSETLQLRDKLDILSSLKERLGEQKIDLTITSQKKLDADLFFKAISLVKL